MLWAAVEERQWQKRQAEDKEYTGSAVLVSNVIEDVRHPRPDAHQEAQTILPSELPTRACSVRLRDRGSLPRKATAQRNTSPVTAGVSVVCP